LKGEKDMECDERIADFRPVAKVAAGSMQV